MLYVLSKNEFWVELVEFSLTFLLVIKQAFLCVFEKLKVKKTQAPKKLKVFSPKTIDYNSSYTNFDVGYSPKTFFFSVGK